MRRHDLKEVPNAEDIKRSHELISAIERINALVVKNEPLLKLLRKTLSKNSIIKF